MAAAVTTAAAVVVAAVAAVGGGDPAGVWYDGNQVKCNTNERCCSDRNSARGARICSRAERALATLY